MTHCVPGLRRRFKAPEGVLKFAEFHTDVFEVMFGRLKVRGEQPGMVALQAVNWNHGVPFN